MKILYAQVVVFSYILALVWCVFNTLHPDWAGTIYADPYLPVVLFAGMFLVALAVYGWWRSRI